MWDTLFLRGEMSARSTGVSCHAAPVYVIWFCSLSKNTDKRDISLKLTCLNSQMIDSSSKSSVHN